MAGLVKSITALHPKDVMSSLSPPAYLATSIPLPVLIILQHLPLWSVAYSSSVYVNLLLLPS